MSMNRSRRLDRRTAEEILDGAPGGRDHALNAVLAAAAGAASEAELRGEHAAVAAFRAARLAPAPRARRRSMIKTMLAKLLTTKLAVAAAAAAAVTAGGVAAVAATGNLPGSPDEHSASTLGDDPRSGHVERVDHGGGRVLARRRERQRRRAQWVPITLTGRPVPRLHRRCRVGSRKSLGEPRIHRADHHCGRQGQGRHLLCEGRCRRRSRLEERGTHPAAGRERPLCAASSDRGAG